MSEQKLIQLLRRWNRSKEPRRQYRRALLGRGISDETSAEVEGRPGYFWVRSREDQRQVYQVLAAGKVPDMVGWPVLVGPNRLSPDTKSEIVDTDWAGLQTLPGASGSLPVLAYHGSTHEYLQQDMVNVHKGMLMPLRARPTVPDSLDVLFNADEAIYVGSERVNMEDVSAYESSTDSVRMSFSGAPDDTWYLAVLDTTPNIYCYTGTAAVQPSVTTAFEADEVPIAHIHVRSGASSILISDILDTRPLYTLPVHLSQHYDWWVEGNVTAINEQGQVYKIDGDQKVRNVTLNVAIAPNDDVIIDHDIAPYPTGTWSSIYSTRPKIASGTHTGGGNAVLATGTLPSGYYLRFDVINEANAQDLSVQLNVVHPKRE